MHDEDDLEHENVLYLNNHKWRGINWFHSDTELWAAILFLSHDYSNQLFVCLYFLCISTLSYMTINFSKIRYLEFEVET